MADDGSGRRDLAVYATLACGDAPVDTCSDPQYRRPENCIIISQSHVNLVKWLYGSLLPIAVGLFATGVAASVLLIAAHDRPFTGKISVGPGPTGHAGC